MSEEIIKSYKGMDKDMRCRGFQYEVGKTYETEHAVACECGFHACESPLDVLNYYPPCDGNRYFAVKQSGTLSRKDDDSKVASTKLTIGAEIGIPGLAKAHVEWVKEHLGKDAVKTNTRYRSAATNTGNQSAATNTSDYSAATNTGDYSAATSTGDQSAATNTGDRSAATNTGEQSAATNTGYRSAATNTGDRSAATSTGDQSAATNTGNRSAATNTGNRSAATNTGDQSAATSTGDQSAAEVSGKASVAISIGTDSKARADIGSAICLVERGDWDGEKYPILNIKAVKIDGKRYKPNVWYRLKNGKVVAAEDA